MLLFFQFYRIREKRFHHCFAFELKEANSYTMSLCVFMCVCVWAMCKYFRSLSPLHHIPYILKTQWEAKEKQNNGKIVLLLVLLLLLPRSISIKCRTNCRFDSLICYLLFVFHFISFVSIATHTYTVHLCITARKSQIV